MYQPFSHVRPGESQSAKRFLILLGLALSVSAVLTGQTFTGPTPYTSHNDSPFIAGIMANTVRVETLENAPPFPNAGTGDLGPAVMASAGSRLSPGGLTDSVDGDDGNVDGSGLAGHSFFSGSGAAGITFTFDDQAPGGLPLNVGIVWTDGSGTTLFEAFGPDNVPLGTIGPVSIADGSNFGTTGEDHFFGVSHSGGIAAIRISNTAGGIEVDHLQYGVSAGPPPPPGSASILVFGDRPGDMENLRVDLVELGHTVTVMTVLPPDLSPYDTIWHVQITDPLTGAEQDRLAGFLASGGGIHLTGERPCCEPSNDGLQTFVNRVVSGGGFVVGDQGDIGGPYPFNPSALSGITTSPNVLMNFNPSASGGMLGFQPGSPNVLATGTGGVVVGGVWGEGSLVSGGRLTLLMDVNWLSNSGSFEVIENLQNFLQGGSGGGEPPPPPCELRCSANVPGQAQQGSTVDFEGELIVEGEDCEVFPPAFQWSFGDGTTSNEQNPQKVYNEAGPFNWQLTIFSGDRSCSESGRINILCDLDCSATVPAQGAANQNVAFAAAVDSDPSCNLPPPTFSWDFGDGSTSTEQNPFKLYTAPGTYVWSVTVRSGNATCMRSGSIQISQACTLGCSASVDAAGVEGQLVNFDSTVTLSSACPESAPSTLWTFGDGTMSSEANPAKFYDEPGTYSWQLTVTLGSLTCVRTGQVTITRAPASVAVTSLPDALVQPVTGGATTTYTVENVGGTPTEVTITQSGNFFTQDPTTFVLEPGESQVVTVTGLASDPGTFEGAALLSGLGVPPGLSIPIVMLASPSPAETIIAVAEESRIDVPSMAGSEPSGTANFTNTGTETINGVLSADVPWIIPQPGVVTILPGETVTVTFTIDPLLRGDEEYGTTVGSLILTYLNGTSGKVRLDSSHGSSTAAVPVHHTVSPGAQPGQIPPLAEGEVALFVPGVANVTGSVGPFLSDIGLTNLTGTNLSGVNLFFKTTGSATATRSTLNQILAGRPLVLGDVAKSVFENTTSVGTLQIRSPNSQRISAAAEVLNLRGDEGTVGTALPTFRSDRSAGPGESLFIPGLESSGNVHTNMYVQEVTGNPAVVFIDFFSADGSSRGGRTDVIEPFGLAHLGSVVPEGAVSAILTTSEDSVGRLVAYATPVDEASGDTWAVADWPRQFGSLAGPSVIPVAASIEGGGASKFVTDVWIFNTGSGTATGTLTFHPQSGDPVSRDVSLGAFESLVVRDILESDFEIDDGAIGYLVYTPDDGNVVTTSRTYTRVDGEEGSVGSSVPSIPVSAALTAGEVRRFGSVDDASAESIALDRPGTYRTNLGIVEVTGSPVTVRVTLNFRSGTQSSAAQGRVTRTFEIGGGEFFQLNEVSRAIIGSSRDTRYKDLTNMQLDVQIVGGDGAVIAFISSLDNASGDSIVRIE